MSSTAGLPRPARLIVAVVIAGGCLAVGTALSDLPGWTGDELLTFISLIGLVAVLEHFQIELRYQRERVTYSMSDAAWTAALLLLRPSVVVLAVAAGVVVGQGLQTWAALKVAFNVAQFSLGIGLAALTFEILGSPPVTDLGSWIAVGISMLVFQAVNTIAMGLLVSAVEHESFWRVALVPTGILHWVGNVAVGILAALLWETEPAAVPLVGVPMVLTYLAYRGWLRTIAEQEQMQDMASAADSIAHGADLARRLPESRSSDEVSILASTLNRMLDRLDAAFQRERLFIRETSHELRTPITICHGHLDVLGDEPTPAELRDTIDVVEDELQRMTRLIQDMTTLASMEDPASLRWEDVSVEQLVAGVANKTAPLLDGRLIVTPGPDDAVVRADPQRLTQALINLLKNAHDHTPEGTPVRLRVAQDESGWCFEVSDQGKGLSPDQETLVFQPFYTGCASNGSGLGLTILAGIAQAHGGRAGVENRPGQGATFWLRIPG